VREASVRRYVKRYRLLRRTGTLEEIKASVRSWIGHVSHADSWRLRAAVLGGSNPLFPASGPATGSFNGLHAKSKFLAAPLPPVAGERQ